MQGIVRLSIRIVSVVFLIAIVWGCGAVPSLHEGSESNYVRLPFVRVLLDSGQDKLVIDSKATFSLEALSSGQNLVYYCSNPIIVTLKRGSVSVSMNGQFIGENFDEIILSPRGNSGYLRYGDTFYRGMMRILPHGTNLQLINVVHLDDYLKGVVPPEIGFSGEDELEAIKAQAVAARTYAMSHLSQYQDKPYDMKSDVSDQVYLGMKVEKNNINRAIDDTRGYVLKSDGNLINAYYHSTCGGYTDDIEEVWDKAEKPYLRAVNDSGYCSWSKYYNWTETYTGRQLRLMIEQYLSSERGKQIKIGDIVDILVRSKTAGGRVSELVVKAAKGTYSFGGDKIRWAIKRASNPELILQSARFKIEMKQDSRGKVERITLIGGGYGHGVGMCQCGAIGMARKGWNYKDILLLYYKNTELVKLY
ncbi:MAG: SpoIID/LytB domain-containing protein [Candidatus Zixiibacteriota bacterium]